MDDASNSIDLTADLIHVSVELAFDAVTDPLELAVDSAFAKLLLNQSLSATDKD